MESSRMANLSHRILSADHSPLLIRLPARMLISRLLLFLAGWIPLLTMISTPLAIVAIPVLVYWSYLYYLYCHIWKRYRLSRFYTVSAPLVAIALALGLRYILFLL